jgi:hypothetical protein
MKTSLLLPLLLLAAFLVTPGICYADMEPESGLGDFFLWLLGSLAVLSMSCVVLTIGNTYWRNRAVRVVCILLLTPLVLVALIACVVSPVSILPLGAMLAVEIFLIKKSYKEANVTE